MPRISQIISCTRPQGKVYNNRSDSRKEEEGSRWARRVCRAASTREFRGPQLRHGVSSSLATRFCAPGAPNNGAPAWDLPARTLGCETCQPTGLRHFNIVGMRQRESRYHVVRSVVMVIFKVWRTCSHALPLSRPVHGSHGSFFK